MHALVRNMVIKSTPSKMASAARVARVIGTSSQTVSEGSSERRSGTIRTPGGCGGEWRETVGACPSTLVILFQQPASVCAPDHIQMPRCWPPCWLIGSFQSVWWREEKREEKEEEKREERKEERRKRERERARKRKKRIERKKRKKQNKKIQQTTPHHTTQHQTPTPTPTQHTTHTPRNTQHTTAPRTTDRGFETKR